MSRESEIEELAKEIFVIDRAPSFSEDISKKEWEDKDFRVKFKYVFEAYMDSAKIAAQNPNILRLTRVNSKSATSQ